RGAILPCPTLGCELTLVERAQLIERGGLLRCLVLADPRNAREAEGEAGRIGRTTLDLVVLDLDDDLGPHAHGVAVVLHRQRPQSLGHRGELGVGQALERLADLRQMLTVPYRQVIVGETAHATARAASGR